MDCCENTKQNKKHENRVESMKGGKSMVEVKKSTMLWIVIGILFIATIFLIVKASSTGTGATKQLDTSSWTANEKMNYEMHGIIPARVQGSAPSTSSGSGMVGGC